MTEIQKKRLLKKIKKWIKDYDDNEEHDLDLTIALKDDAYHLLWACVDALK